MTLYSVCRGGGAVVDGEKKIDRKEERKKERKKE